MTERKKPNFYRRQWRMKSRLKRKSERKWRRPRGRDNKIRLKFKGLARKAEIGWGNAKKDYGKIDGAVPNYIENIKQMGSLQKGQAIIISRIGGKKKKDIIKKANELGLKILNRYIKEKKCS